MSIDNSIKVADSIIAGNGYLDRMRNMGDNNCLRDIYTQAYQAGCRFLYLNLKLNVLFISSIGTKLCLLLLIGHIYTTNKETV